ncbi:MAG: hypothetical protein WC794_05385 [Candidatus Doudnabacteria bacterium]
MRTKILLATLVFSIFSIQSVSAQGMMGYGGNTGTSISQGQDPAINTALQDIYTSQNINSQSQVSCSKITDDQFEKLGDASMGYGITEQQHTAMENMMGGEGSATVKQAHINMGRAYLGCWANYNSAPVQIPMMGYYSANSTNSVTGLPGYRMMNGYYNNQGSNGITGLGFNQGWNMMGGFNGGYGWFGLVTMIFIWALLILSIAALVKWLKKK